MRPAPLTLTATCDRRLVAVEVSSQRTIEWTVEVPPALPEPANAAPNVPHAGSPADTNRACTGAGASGSASGAISGCNGDGAVSIDLDAFILSNLKLPDVRRGRVAALAAHARPFSYARHERLMTLGNMFSRNVD